jgi:hypothetical protein
MADERIDVEVTDKVSSSVESKLRGIGDAAGNAHKYVEQLKDALASMSVAGAVKTEAAANSTARALAQQMTAQARLTEATAKGALADAKAATEKQRLATETARTEAATARASAAQSAAAAASLRAAQAAERAAASQSSLAARAERLKASLDPAYAAQARFDAELREAKSLLDAGAIGMNHYADAVQQADARLKAAASGFGAVGRAAGAYSGNMNNVAGATGLAGHQMGNLVAQLNDVGVSLAGGQNPLLVLIQQGSQIQYLASTVEGGFATLLKATAALVIGQQQVTNATTTAAAANVANAQSSATAAAANAAQAGVAANLVLAEQALTVAQTEAGAAAARQAVANAALSSAQAAVAATATPTTAALSALALAEARATAAAQAGVVANAELAAAQSGVAASALAAAQAQQRLALSSAGTALGLGTVGAVLVGIGAVLAPVLVKIKSFHDELNDNSGIKDYVATLGLTTKELKELENQTITYGDLASGVWATIKEGVAGLQPVFDAIGSFIMGTIDLIWETLKNFSFGLTALFQGSYRSIVTIWNNFGPFMSDVFVSAANAAISAIEWIVNKTIDGINWVAQQANGILSNVGLEPFGQLANQTLGRFENAAAGTAGRVGAEILDNYMGSFNDAEAGYNRFLERTGQNAEKAARERLAAEAATIIGDRPDGPKGRTRTGREDKTEENRALALANVNRELDNELSRMRLLKDERAVQQRFDQISEELARKRITLSAEEATAIRNKIVAIEADKYVQSERDRIVEEALGPTRDMNSAITAANQLLAAGTITVEQYNAEMFRSARAHKEATDPLFALTEQMGEAERALGLYGDAQKQAAYYEQIRAAFLAKNIELSPTYVAGLNAEVDALMRRNQELTREQEINAMVAEVVDPILQNQAMLDNKILYYSELQRLREQDVLSEEQYQQAKYALDAKFSEMRLTAASDFFGALAGVTKNGTGAIGAISKAAAVAQATIDGYVAVQKALASAPPPFNYIAAAAVALKTGTQVAGILSTNVGSYATGGQFMVEGKAGIDNNNINMNVSRGERVTIETAAQQRANDSGGNGSVIQGDVKIVNQFDEREFVAAMDSEEGERIILNVIKRNPNAIQGTVDQ